MKIHQIKKELRKAGLYQKEEARTKNIDSDRVRDLLKNVEIFLVTARSYSDTNTLLPRNPLLRLVKRTLLFPAREILKIQTVYNKNILFALEEISDYLKEHEKSLNRTPKKKA